MTKPLDDRTQGTSIKRMFKPEPRVLASPNSTACAIDSAGSFPEREIDRGDAGVARAEDRTMDTVAERRSRLMARVRQRDTKPEMAVRRAAHALGFRFRLQRGDLPGRPDLVFPKLDKVLFVHGCFWHSHRECKSATVPKTRTEYWDAKLAANRARDLRVAEALRQSGWDVGIVWECETRKRDELLERLRAFLSPQLDYAAKHPEYADSVTKRERD